jgi:inosine-uridine nucleoside N-ribohydrolase
MDNLVIFSDAGIDDILAINYIIKSKKYLIKAIVATHGNLSTDRAYEVLTYFFGKKTSIYLGKSNISQSHLIHQGIENIKISKIDNKTDFYNNLKEIFSENNIVLSLAPLTDLANVITNDNINITQIIIMGGAFNNGIGNDSPYSEFNFMIDPSAAMEILKSTYYPTIIPLDVTRQITFGDEYERHLTADYKSIFNHQRNKYLDLGQTQVPLHDLTATCFLISPDAFTLQHIHAEVIMAPSEYAGCLLIDQHMYERKPSNCLIARSVEASRIKYEVTKQMPKMAYE